MIIWLIGAFFTVGLFSKTTENLRWSKFLFAHINILFLWPFMLGVIVREIEEKYGIVEKEQTK